MSAHSGSAYHRFPEQILAHLRERCPLVPVVQEAVELKRAGKNWTGCCPFHAEKTPSFTVFPDNRFKCFGCGVRGDVFTFVEMRHGVPFPEAVEHVASVAGVSLPDTYTPRGKPLPTPLPASGKSDPSAPRETWRPIVPVPADIPKPTVAQLRCDRLHEYRDEGGRLLHYVTVMKATSTRRKQPLPLTYGTLNGRAGWHRRGPGNPRPLYGLDRLAGRPNAPVMLHEGEWKADAGRGLWPEYVHLSISGGAKAVASNDLVPIEHRALVYSPDNDMSGHQAAAAIVASIPNCRVIRVNDLPATECAVDVEHEDPAGWLRKHLPAESASKEPKPPDPDILPLIWLEDIQPILEARDFVQGVLVEKALTVIYGDSHAGKTFWTTDLALHVAAGKTWNGRRVDQAGVVYCVLEGGDGFRNRVSAWRNANPDIGKLPFAEVPCALNLMDPQADTSKLIATIEAASQLGGLKVQLVVVDTLSRALAGGNENSPEDMGALVINADRIRAQTGVNLAFVHHSGKDAAKGARGHSLLRAAVDTEIEVIANEETGVRTATIVKQRDIAKGDAIAFRLDTVVLGTNQYGEDVTTCTVSQTEAQTCRSREAKLSDRPATLLRTLRNMHPDQIHQVRPQPEMPMVTAVRRDHLRSALIAQSWFPENLLCAALNPPKLERAGYGFEYNSLITLKRRGFIGFNREWIWLL